MTNGIFIIGTDTDVGKTLISASIAFNLSHFYTKVCVMKPFATSDKIFSDTFDSEDLYLLSKAIAIIEDQRNLNPYFFELAGSPYMASEILKMDPPNLKTCLDKFLYLKQKYDFVIVEGIGGIMVPLNEKENLIDFIKLTNLEVIIVTTPKLGTLNHTLLTVYACRNYGIPIKGIIVNKMPLTSSNIIEEKIPSYINKLTKIPILGVLPLYENIMMNTLTFKRISDLIDYSPKM